MTAHKPGPWQFDGPPHNHIVWDDKGDRICFMAHSGGKAPDRDTATARLIAGAPDLLDALNEAESFISGFEDDELQEGVDDMLRRIRGAISKATES